MTRKVTFTDSVRVFAEFGTLAEEQERKKDLAKAEYRKRRLAMREKIDELRDSRELGDDIDDTKIQAELRKRDDLKVRGGQIGTAIDALTDVEEVVNYNIKEAFDA